jgi:3-phenylpropionate/trans-cinnamate dioxygenase ferredoxin reductase subunit
VQSVEAINAPAEFMMGKQLILSRQPVEKAKLLDTGVSMKEVAA